MSEVREPGLLVSVRSRVEAEFALRGGAAIIDVKDPSRGPLGKADDATIADVIECVAGRRPVSAALGELIDHGPSIPQMRLDFVKWGLSRYGGTSKWQHALGRLISKRQCDDPRIVLVAYADWQTAQAPSVAEVARFACQFPEVVFMIDTFDKALDPGTGARRTLLDSVAVDEVFRHCEQCRQAGVKVALAGSLTENAIERLKPIRPDWFAVRGAVCSGTDRLARVEVGRARRLVQLIADHASSRKLTASI